ncbi:TraR/DksA C4-type zinc finger protein [Salmonella enterica]|nr:TraR/DksA C4-type zinc finger protein [Salmonella enterica]EKC2693933.1 TraR/DksA C4-type zinc finger protein [Salmonella enterica]
MSVDTDDAMAQREAMLHTDLQIAAIRQALKTGEPVSRRHCADCGEEIPEKRRASLPGVRRCADCQAWHEERGKG